MALESDQETEFVPEPSVPPAGEGEGDVGLTPEKLAAALDSHELWLKTGGEHGRRLVLKDVTFPVLPNPEGPDLQGLYLQGRDLSQADLCGIQFGAVSVKDTRFTDADLTDADLSQVTGLLPHRLGGSMLRGARLPTDFTTDSMFDHKFDQVSRIEEMSKNSGKYFVAVLLGCAYVLLTVYSTTDAGLLSNLANSTLPFLQTPISIVGFYQWAPLLLLGVFVFFQLNLQSLWAALASLPAVFPDGRHIHTMTYPWLVNELGRFYSRRLKNTAQVCVTSGATLFLTFGSVPVTLLFPWGRSLHRHDLVLSHWLSLVVAVSVLVALGSGLVAQQTLGRERMTQAFARRQPTMIQNAVYLLLFMVCCFVGIITLESWKTAWWVQSTGGLFLYVLFLWLRKAARWIQVGGVALLAGLFFWGISGRIIAGEITPIPLVFFLDLGNANVSHANVSARPDRWTGKDRGECEAVAGAALVGADLRRLSGESSFLVHADMRGADLEDADLTNADLRACLLQKDTNSRSSILRNVRLVVARLEWANLSEADLRGANLSGADLTSADLSYAHLAEAQLEYVHLTKAQLRGADLTRAGLVSADLRGANFSEADLTSAFLWSADLAKANFEDAHLAKTFLDLADLAQADLRLADLAHANLNGANLSGADLQEANLSGADLQEANLSGADLSYTNLGGADLYEADLRGVNLSTAHNLTPEMLSEARGDSHTKLPAGMARPANWPK